MTKTVVQNRVRALEAEVRVLKNAVLEKPDLSVDGKNWQKVKGTSKKIRAKLYKARYA